ncbi:glycosyltransferase family 2 protein [Oenococcus oeni]
MAKSESAPFFSLIVPVYNVEDYLERLYTSFEKQKFDDFEIIFVNDLSTDGSLKKLQLLSKRDARIKIIDKDINDPKGAGASRNKGFRVASGKYVYFIDADDFLSDNSLSIIYNAVQKNKPDELLFGYNNIDGKGRIISRSDSTTAKNIALSNPSDRIELSSDIFVHNSFYTVWNRVYSRKFIIQSKIRFGNTRTAQDAIFNVDLFSKVVKISWIPDCLYNYGVGRKSSNQTVLRSKFSDELILLKHLEIFLSSSVEPVLKGRILQFFDLEKYRVLVIEAKFAVQSTNIFKPFAAWETIAAKAHFAEYE